MRKYRVLSLFGGIETGWAALNDAGVPIEFYYSSETDPQAIKSVKWNYPDIVHIGDVKNVTVRSLPFVPDLVIGGFPCQDLSSAGKGAGLSGVRSGLFFEAVRILKECREVNPSILFLFENVSSMKKADKHIISETLEVLPWENNASLVSAQNRNRLWWSNIRTKTGLFGDVWTDFPQPKDAGILLSDILEKQVDKKYYLSGAALERISRSKFSRAKINPEKTETINCKNNSGQLSLDSGTTLVGVVNNNGILNQVEKSNCIDANYHKGPDNHGQRTLAMVVRAKNGAQRKNQYKASTYTAGAKSGGEHSDMDVIVTHNLMPRNGRGSGGKGPLSKTDGKSYCVDTGQKNAVEIRGPETILRRLTPVEVCRLFTLPDNFFQTPSGPIVSQTSQYRLLGNGWVMKVVSHIFSFLPELT